MAAMEHVSLIFSPFAMDHIPAVMHIESEAYPEPWTYQMFRQELENRQGYFCVMYFNEEIAGYGGFWLLLDEVVLDWTQWLSAWPTIISNGVVPLALILFGLLLLDEFVHHGLKTNGEERTLFLFVFLLVAFVVLTAVGIFLRGPGMALTWPWLVSAH